MVSMDFVGMTLNLQFCCKIKINIQREKTTTKTYQETLTIRSERDQDPM